LNSLDALLALTCRVCLVDYKVKNLALRANFTLLTAQFVAFFDKKYRLACRGIAALSLALAG
jgi:hypothetical protein